MYAWPILKQGDIVDIIAPGYGASERSINKCAQYLTSLGLVPRIGDHIHGDDLFSSNNENARFNDLKDALYNTESKAVWCLKGGYGTAHLIPRLAALAVPTTPKCIIGFSDITALHIFVQQAWKWQSLHAPVLWQIIREKIDEESLNALKQTLFNEKSIHNFSLNPLNIAAQQHENITAPIIGGNLTLVQSSIGTCWHINTAEKILFLEDIDEHAYRTDRRLNHFKQAGLLDEVKAIVFGDFNSNMIADIDHEKTNQTLIRFAQNTTLPVLRLSGIGHTERNAPLPLGCPATLTLGKTAQLSLTFA